MIRCLLPSFMNLYMLGSENPISTAISLTGFRLMNLRVRAVLSSSDSKALILFSMATILFALAIRIPDIILSKSAI